MINTMNYNVHIAPVPSSKLLGVEIQPPISDKAFDGIRAMLCDTEHGPEAPEAALAEMTRNDTVGTAFVFGKNEGASDIDRVASMIGSLISPAGIHEVTILRN